MRRSGHETWDEVKSASTVQILAWAEAQPWAHAMAECQQDAEWHAEGDVWTHTQMVVAELERLAEWPALDAAHATCNCSSRPCFTTRASRPRPQIDPATGRTHSPKHAAGGRGDRPARCCATSAATWHMREEIAGLVRYHGRPPFLLEKPDPAHEVISLSWLVNHRLLYLFALADTRGRQTREMSRPEENLHLWKLVAEENGCFDQPYPFANDQARFLFYRGALSSLHYTPHEDTRCTVTLMAGLARLGQGHVAGPASPRPAGGVAGRPAAPCRRRRHRQPGGDRPAARERCREHLRAGRDFAFNATNILRQTRKRWIDLFADYGRGSNWSTSNRPWRRSLHKTTAVRNVSPRK